MGSCRVRKHLGGEQSILMMFLCALLDSFLFPRTSGVACIPLKTNSLFGYGRGLDMFSAGRFLVSRHIVIMVLPRLVYRSLGQSFFFWVSPCFFLGRHLRFGSDSLHKNTSGSVGICFRCSQPRADCVFSFLC